MLSGCHQLPGVIHTFIDDGHPEWYADDAHEVFGWHQGLQDGTDTQRFPFALADELGDMT